MPQKKILEPPGLQPDSPACQLKQEYWTRRTGDTWEDYFIRMWKRMEQELTLEEIPLHVSEYLKPSSIWIYHDEG